MKILLELNWRRSSRRSRRLFHWYRGPSQIVDVCQDLCSERNGARRLFYLGDRNQLVVMEEYPGAFSDLREIKPHVVLCNARQRGAAAVVLVHFYPQGPCRPSHSDMQITERLAVAATAFKIDFVDHIILDAQGRYYSFREAGRIPDDRGRI